MQPQPWYLSLDDALLDPLLASAQKEPPGCMLDNQGSLMAAGQPPAGCPLSDEHLPPVFYISSSLLLCPHPPLGTRRARRFGLEGWK